MRLLWSIVLALLLAAPASALAADVPLPETITGGGHIAATTFTIAIRAGANGEDPVGTLTTSGFYNFTATVTCVNIAGSAAVTGYRIDTPPYAGYGFLASGRDNGLGNPAEVFYSGVLAAPPTTCPPPSEGPPPFLVAGGGGPMTSGELVQTGGPPETTPPWQNTPGTPVTGPTIFPPLPVPVLQPEQSLTPLRLGQSQLQVGGVLARKALLIRPAFNARGRVSRLASAAPGLRLYGRRVSHGYTALRPVLKARGWRVTTHGATRVAHRRTRRGSSTITWRRGALVRAVVAKP